MPASSFRFHVCQNPACGLRYPVTDRSVFGERCPICLGTTVVAARGELESEQATREPTQPSATSLGVLVDNVRSAWNVGSVFRSAEGYGIPHLYLCGITPTPDEPQVKKTALGAERSVSWSSHRNGVELAASLKAGGHVIWALERTRVSQPIELAVLDMQSVKEHILVVGNEQTGIDPGILDLADRVVHLEMYGRKRSFNVGVAFALAAHVIQTRPHESSTAAIGGSLRK